MTEIIISFLSGMILALFGVLVGYYFQKRLEKSKEKEKIRFEIYMNLLDISSYYFWITTAEIHNEKPSIEIVNLLRDLSFKTLDKLRQADDIEYLNEILEVLFSENFDTAKERAVKFDELLERLHRKVSPNFAKKINQISKDNLLLSKPLSKLNAPGTPKILN